MNAITDPISEWMRTHPSIIYTGQMQEALRYFAKQPRSLAIVPRVLFPHAKQITGARIIERVQGAAVALDDDRPAIISPDRFTMLAQAGLFRGYERRLLLHADPMRLRGYSSHHSKAVRYVRNNCGQFIACGFPHVSRPGELWVLARLLRLTDLKLPDWIATYAITIQQPQFFREFGFKTGAVETLAEMFKAKCFPLPP